MTKIQRLKMQAELTLDVINNPQDWDEGFLEMIPKLNDEWLKVNHGDIGYKYKAMFHNAQMDLNRAFA